MNVEPESPLMDIDEAHLEAGDRGVPVKESVCKQDPESKPKPFLGSKSQRESKTLFLLKALPQLHFLKCFASASLQGKDEDEDQFPTVCLEECEAFFCWG